MANEYDALNDFRDAFLDYLEGERENPPTVADLPVEQRRAAESFIDSITAARGVDPYASRPSLEQLLDAGPSTSARAIEFSERLQDHLRRTIDSRASVAYDVASDAIGMASVSVIQAWGMRLRVVREEESADLAYSFVGRADAIAEVFSAFPDTHAVLYSTAEREPLGVIVDRADVHGAIETPSGERRDPRMRRQVTDSVSACEGWFRGLIPEFEPLSINLNDNHAAVDSALDPYHLASRVVAEVSASGMRARIPEKRDTWQNFGEREAHRLVAIVEAAQRGPLSDEDYRSQLDAIVETAA